MKLTSVLVLLAVAIGATTAQTNPCPNDFVVFWMDEATPICLLFNMYGKGTWDMQRASCQAMGADLAILEGDLHQQVVDYINAHENMTDEGFWFGGTDAGHEGTWTWIHDGSAMPMGTPHWYPGQPNGGVDQNYVGLYTPDFYFHSLPNTHRIYSICQI